MTISQPRPCSKWRGCIWEIAMHKWPKLSLRNSVRHVIHSYRISFKLCPHFPSLWLDCLVHFKYSRLSFAQYQSHASGTCTCNVWLNTTCDWYALYCANDKLLYGHSPDPFLMERGLLWLCETTCTTSHYTCRWAKLHVCLTGHMNTSLGPPPLWPVNLVYHLSLRLMRCTCKHVHVPVSPWSV